MTDEVPPDRSSAPRRGFLAGAMALALGAAAGLAPLVGGLRMVLDPLRKRSTAAGMVPVARLSALPEDGAPRRFPVIMERRDAWTNHGETPVGAVYLRRVAGQDVRAFNVVCPHAGCFVGVKPDESGFACPCHRSSFDLDGEVDDPSSPAPRGMDPLDVDVRPDGSIWVRFVNYQPGREGRVQQA